MKPRRKLLKKPVAIIPKLELEEIIGVTITNCNGLASNFGTSRCVYTAGCVALVYNVELGTQAHFMVVHRAPKPLSCVAISLDGRYVAAGETGKQASVSLWDCESLSLVSELKGHQHGIVSIAFSPDGKHMASAGSTSDGYIYLWHWHSGTLISKIKANSSSFATLSLSFTSDAKSVVIAGTNHLKICSIRSSSKPNSNSRAGSLMFGKPVGFATQKGSSFISVACPLWTTSDSVKTSNEFSSIYALTDTGILCQLSPGFLITKSVNLKVEKGYALSASKYMIACACSCGIVQLFTIDTLTYAGELLYSPDTNRHDENDILGLDKMTHADTWCASTLPDAVACQFSTSEKLVVIYGDNSLYVWDVHDACKPIRICVVVSHSTCIWDIKALSCENNHNASVACAAKGCSGGISFATCSGDGTIRIWDFTFQSILSDVITDSPLTYETLNTAMLVNSGIIEPDAVGIEINKQGFRSMAVSNDGKYLAAGDSLGNLLIYNLKTSTCVCIQDAHGEEVLSVSFSSQYKESSMPGGIVKGNYLFASGGRDGIVLLYDIERDFVVIGSIDHSTPVTAVQLASSGSRIISGDVDGSLIIHDIGMTASGCKLVCHRYLKACSGALYDMFVDPMVEFAVTVAQGTDICTFDISSGELVHSFKRSECFGDPIKVTMDPSCSYLLCSYSNKMMCIYDYLTGELVAQAIGHSEVITGIIFLPNCKHIVSVGGDGCIFVWKVPTTLSERMMQCLKENSCPLSPLNIAQPLIRGAFLVCEDDDVNQESLIENNCFSKSELSFSKVCHESSAFRFSISRLPKWAQKEVVSSETISLVTDTISSQNADVYSTPLARHDQVNTSLRNKAECFHDLALEDIKRITNSVSSTDTCNSGIRFYINSEEAKSFSKKRWQTIHTVCLDLISPEVSNHINPNMPLSSINLVQSTSEDCLNGNAKCCHEIKENDLFGSLVSKDLHKGSLNTMAEKLTPANGNRVQSIIEAEDKHEAEDKQDSLFEQHFSSLSAVRKAVIHPTVSKRCSSRFFVRQNHVNSYKTLINSREEVCNRKADPDISSEQFSPDDAVKEAPLTLPVKEHDLMKKAEVLLNADFGIFKPESLSPTDKRESPSEQLNQLDSVECKPKTVDEQEVVTQCREALSGLNAAAESVHNLFSTLVSLLPQEDCLASPTASVFHEAVGLLPSVAEKIHAVSNLAHRETKKHTSTHPTWHI